MSFSDKRNKERVEYSLEMSNGDTAEVSIYSGNETEKITYLKHFLEVNRDQDVFFIDSLSGKLYSKNHIVACEEKKA